MDIATLTRKARYGHRQYVYWFDTDGVLVWASYGRSGIKRAILSVGAKGRFYILDTSGIASVAKSLRMMLVYWKCAPPTPDDSKEAGR